MTQVFKVGDKNPYISKIQRFLNRALNIKLVADGGFGQLTKSALQDWQVVQHQKQIANISPTGIYDDATANVIDPIIAQLYLTEADYATAAGMLGVSVAHVKAVTEVEAKGSGFFDGGQPVILFERHVFRKQLRKRLDVQSEALAFIKKHGIKYSANQNAQAVIDEYLSLNYSDIYNSKTGGYKGGQGEYVRLDKAIVLYNADVAYESASWGLFQIMGYHYSLLGYKNASAMVAATATAERVHLNDFCKFILADKRLLNALRAKNWAEFARIYNGPAYRENSYDVKLAMSFAKWNA